MRDDKPTGCLIAVLVAIAVVALFAAFAPYYTTQIWWEIRGSLFWLLPLLVVIALGLSAVVAFDGDNNSAGAGLTLFAIIGAVATIGWLFIHEYQQDRHYVATVTVTDTPVPALQQRTPYNVSQAQVRPNLGDIPGDIQQTTFLPDREVFTTPVERRGAFTGYQTLLVQAIGESGRNTPSRCDFLPAADRRIGGLFTHSLERLVNTRQRGVNWDRDDVYGWCDNGVPKIVVPLKEQDGWLLVTERPAGIAIYDGATGRLDIRSDAEGVPGPSYPLSLAAEQRESTDAIAGFGDWFWNRAGWELPDEADNINSDNSAEFVLATDTGNGVYATMLTGRGSATAVSAVSIVNAHLTRGDALAPLAVHRTRPVWLSPTSITERVRADFGDVFATQREARIFELAPMGGNRWSASIGLPQNLIYRVHGVGDLTEPPCLVALDGRQLRCGPAVNVNGAGPGVALGGQTPVSPAIPPAAANSDLGTLTNDQLIDLDNRVNQETARRLAGTGGP